MNIDSKNPPPHQTSSQSFQQGNASQPSSSSSVAPDSPQSAPKPAPIHASNATNQNSAPTLARQATEPSPKSQAATPKKSKSKPARTAASKSRQPAKDKTSSAKKSNLSSNSPNLPGKSSLAEIGKKASKKTTAPLPTVSLEKVKSFVTKMESEINEQLSNGEKHTNDVSKNTAQNVENTLNDALYYFDSFAKNNLQSIQGFIESNKIIHKSLEDISQHTADTTKQIFDYHTQHTHALSQVNSLNEIFLLHTEFTKKTTELFQKNTRKLFDNTASTLGESFKKFNAHIKNSPF